MFPRLNGWMWVAFTLVAIGFFASLIKNPIGIIIPLVIFGAIVYFLKYPPKWLIQWTSPRRYVKRQDKKTVKKKKGNRIKRGNVTLTVIDGRKKDFPPRRRKTDRKTQ